MSKVSKEPPAVVRKYRRSKWSDLVDAAMAERGDWFSAPSETNTNSANLNIEVRRVVGIRFSDLTVRDGKVYLRILPDSEVSS